MSKLPIYSQHLDVSDKHWRSRACGIVALKTVMDPLHPEVPCIDDLLKIGVAMGAYDERDGWILQGLAKTAKRFNLQAVPLDLSNKSEEDAIRQLKDVLAAGPCVISVYKDFDRKNGGHLIVGIEIVGQRIFYNDPNSHRRGSVFRRRGLKSFCAGWRRRLIIVRK